MVSTHLASFKIIDHLRVGGRRSNLVTRPTNKVNGGGEIGEEENMLGGAYEGREWRRKWQRRKKIDGGRGCDN